jgi:hypothetical protein
MKPKMESTQVFATALGDATQDGPPAGAVLSRDETEPGAKIAPAFKTRVRLVPAISAVALTFRQPGLGAQRPPEALPPAGTKNPRETGC